MNSSLHLKFLIAFLLTVYKYHLPAECVYCYVCNGNYQACADPPDLNAIRYNMEPCNGQCVVYINQWTGVLTRSCSNYLGISGSGVETINGVTYSFCQYDGCNAGGAPSLVVTTPSPTIGVVTTNAGAATTIAGGMTTILPALTTSALAGCSRGCVNMGTQNKDCSCSCLALYSGAFCEIVNCDPASQYPFCATDFTTQDCTQEAPYILCPKLCNPECSIRASTTTPVATKPITTTAAPTTIAGCSLQCQSASILNTTTCTCKCLPGTSGAQCEIIDCKQADANWCGAVACTDDPSIKFYCIQKCNTCSTTVPPVLTTPVITAAPTTPAPTIAALTTTTQKCPGLTCYSASTLDEATCTCNCLSAATYGTNCQFIDCSVQDPLFCSFSACNASPNIPFQCTHLCGLCPSVQTTAAPTVAPTADPTTAAPTAAPTTVAPSTKAPGSCVPIDCKFGGIFDLKTCICECPDNFFGTDCSVVSVSPDWTDPVECNDPAMSCGAGLTLDQDIAGMCPLKCLFCGRKVCMNGGLLKTDCSCQCLPAYSADPTCSTKICIDNPGCGTQFPLSACGLYTEIVSMCPIMCKATGC